MKKFLMTIAAAFVATTMSAQMYVGGGIGFENKSYDGESATSLSITPELGYVLDENASLGISLGFGQSGKDDAKKTTISVQPYYRYKFMKTEKVDLFVDGTFYFANVKGDGYKDKDYKANAWGIGVRPGVAVALNDKLSFVSTMGFLGYESFKPDGDKATNTFGFDLNSLNLSFGLYYNF